MENIGIQVPFSTGRNIPKVTVPANACDCHHHIYDPVRFAYQPTDVRNQPPSTVDCYRMLQKRLGTSRNVIIQPSAYGTDNRCTLDALQQMGKENTRAVAVIDDSISQEELWRMNELGVCGIRFNINCGDSDDLNLIERLAERIAPMKWSICFWMDPDLTVRMEHFLRSLPCEIIFDHRGHIPAKKGADHPAVHVISRMLKENKAWVKLSGLYHDSNCENYEDTIAIGKIYVEANLDRLLWGTDWPHPSCYSGRTPVPNDADLLDALMVQAGTEDNFRKILVDNPARLFGFDNKGKD